ncbi:MAG TPA: glutamine--fructose-6-phosphate transaminase (isomerizing), partial [bacterium]|nr:glutamine--fructose-6-phosphate transaminase (isomerizing) [bacterium]
PHFDCKKEIFVVHNGIVENWRELRQWLEKKGHKFISETDTEVFAHLIEEFYQESLEEALRKALSLIKGAYGIVVFSKKEPQKILTARLSSPIVVAQNGASSIVASDVSAILPFSREVIFLEDGEMATLEPGKIKIFNFRKNSFVKKLPQEIEWKIEEAQKGGYPHFMLKEIMEQPQSLLDSQRGRVLVEEGKAKLGGIEPVKDKLREIERIIIVACGTAFLAGKVGEYMIEEYAQIPVEVELASEFRYKKPVFDEKTCVLAISQSGETADTLMAVREAKEKGVLTLGVVNVCGSTIAREVTAGVYNHCGPEIGVAATKSFTSQLEILALLTLFLGRQREMSFVMGQRIAKEIKLLPELAKKVLEENFEKVKAVAKKYKDYQNFLFIGRKYNYPIALEGALKLKEISYIHAEGYAAGEMKHGPIALIDENFPTVAICPKDSVYEKVLSNIEEIKARNGKVIAITTEGNKELENLADEVFYIPKTLEMLTPILTVLPLQLFAYFVGTMRGID